MSSLAELEWFRVVAGAPNGVQRLRELVLQLAVQGKLVPQDPTDEPASELLKRIAAEKERLISEGKIKRQKPLPAITEEEKPFELPKGWEWVRLNNVYDVRDGTHDSPKYISSGIPLITSKNLFTGKLDLSDVKFISENDHIQISARSKVDKHDILFAMIGTIGNPVIVDTDARFSIKNVALFKYYTRELVNPKYLLIILKVAAQYFKKESSGGVQSFISLSNLRNYIFALAPLSEQKRVVEKVDSLLALCDQLEVLQSQQSTLQVSTWQEVLNAITQASSTLDLTKAWQRLEQQLALLVTEPEQVKGLRDTILQLAVQGKLVPQDPNDEPASVLLTKIQAEKERLIKAGKIKRQKPLPPITDEEKPFELPKGWEWARWDDIALKIGDIDHKMPEQTKDGIPYISPRDFLPKNGIDFAQAKKIDISDFEKLALKIVPQRGDIIYPRYGTIGENRLIETDIKFLASYSCAVIKVLHGYIDPLYQFIFSVSPLAKNQAKAAENKTTQANVGLKSIQLYLVPLAPYDEQSRIAEKYNLLMSLCDQLEARLQAARQTQAQFALETVNNLSTQ
jgi:type I restriction enzyme S subunit